MQCVHTHGRTFIRILLLSSYIQKCIKFLQRRLLRLYHWAPPRRCCSSISMLLDRAMARGVRPGGAVYLIGRHGGPPGTVRAQRRVVPGLVESTDRYRAHQI